MLAIHNDDLITNAEGWMISRTIITGVSLTIFPHGEATLNINEREVIRFMWTKEAEAMFDEIDTAEPIELLELLHRFQIK